MATWCAQSGTVAFTVSEIEVDFGGNKRDTTHNDGYFTDICKWLMWLVGSDESNCDDY